MQRLFALLERLAATQSTVLISGESGTGKELVARALHYHRPRCHHPFIPVHCAAMPVCLLESKLFGHVKGAFTGAHIARKGLFLEATQGTIFLDEMGEMPLGMQAKLLRVLEQYHIRAVHSDREAPVDVRMLAATNRDLEAAVEQGTSRADLFYRLKVMTVRVPPLQAHPDDIAFLAETFLQRHATAAQGLVATALKKTRGHKSQAAALLGVHPRTLTRMMRRYGMPDEHEEVL